MTFHCSCSQLDILVCGCVRLCSEPKSICSCASEPEPESPSTVDVFAMSRKFSQKFEGDSVGLKLGAVCGESDGGALARVLVGERVGILLGPAVGTRVGEFEGLCLGLSEGTTEGDEVGLSVADAEGDNVGLRLGPLVGESDGNAVVGLLVGDGVGLFLALAVRARVVESEGLDGGLSEGASKSDEVELCVGDAKGETVGLKLGALVGETNGDVVVGLVVRVRVGLMLGPTAGAGVGDDVGFMDAFAIGSNVSSKFGDALGSTNAGIVWAVTRTRSGKVTAALVEMYVPVIATVASGVSESIGDGVSIIGLVVRGEV